MPRKRTPWAAISARWRSLAWSAKGQWSLSRGQLPQALEAFREAVSARPDGFRPLLRLTYGYLLTRDYWRAHRTLAQAREADPIRFARFVPDWLVRVGLPVEARRRLLGSPVVRADEAGHRAPERPEVAAHREPSRRPAVRRVDAAQLPLGDCRDLDEYARFRAMPPISDGERESIDWDAVLEDLLEP